MSPRVLLIITFGFALAFSGCQSKSPEINRTPTATPDMSKITITIEPSQTPGPTFTPLVGGGRTITLQDYGQTIILDVGESFTLQNLTYDATYASVEIQDPKIVEQVSGPSDLSFGDQVYRANAPGTTALIIYVPYPCPNAPIGCRPPEPRYLGVTVLGEVQATPTETPYSYPPTESIKP